MWVEIDRNQTSDHPEKTVLDRKRGERGRDRIQRDRNRTERGDRVERGKREKRHKRRNRGGERTKEGRGERQDREDPSQGFASAFSDVGNWRQHLWRRCF